MASAYHDAIEEVNQGHAVVLIVREDTLEMHMAALDDDYREELERCSQYERGMFLLGVAIGAHELGGE